MIRPLANTLENLKTALTDKLSSSSINLGAPIIGADVKLLTVSMITDPNSKNTQATTVEYLPTALPNKNVDSVIVKPELPLVNPTVSTPIVITSPPFYNNTVI